MDVPKRTNVTRRHALAVAATDMVGVTAQTTDHLQGHVLAGAFDEEAVVALESIDNELFKAAVSDEQARTEDTLVGDHEVVAEFRADDDDRVRAVAAVDADRRVDRVADRVDARVTRDVRAGGVVAIPAGSKMQGSVTLVGYSRSLPPLITKNGLLNRLLG